MHSGNIGRSFKTEKEMQQSRKLMWDSEDDNPYDEGKAEDFLYRDTIFEVKAGSFSNTQYDMMVEGYYSELESGLEDEDIYEMDSSGEYFNAVRSSTLFPGAVRVLVEGEELIYYNKPGENDSYTEAVEYYLNKKMTESVNNWQYKNKSILASVKNDNSVLVIDKSDSERNPLLAVGIGSGYNCIYTKCKWSNPLNKDNERILDMFLSTAFRILENLGIKETEPSNEIKNIISNVTLSINFPGISASFKPLEVGEEEKISERIEVLSRGFIGWGGDKSILLFDATEIGSKSLDFVQMTESFFKSLEVKGVNIKRVYSVKPEDLDKEKAKYILSGIPQKVVLKRNPNGEHINDIMEYLNRFKDSGKHEKIDEVGIEEVISRLSMELEWANNESTGSIESYLEGLQNLLGSHKINIASKLLITPYGEYNTSSKWYYVAILIYLATLEVNNYDEEEAKRYIKSVNNSLIKSIWSESKSIHNLI